MQTKNSRFSEMQKNYLKNLIYEMQMSYNSDEKTYQLAVDKLAKLYEEENWDDSKRID